MGVSPILLGDLSEVENHGSNFSVILSIFPLPWEKGFESGRFEGTAAVWAVGLCDE